MDAQQQRMVLRPPAALDAPEPDLARAALLREVGELRDALALVHAILADADARLDRLARRLAQDGQRL